MKGSRVSAYNLAGEVFLKVVGETVCLGFWLLISYLSLERLTLYFLADLTFLLFTNLCLNIYFSEATLGMSDPI